MSHKRRRQKNKFQECGHTAFGKYCHFCKQIAQGKAKPRKIKSEGDMAEAAAASTGTATAASVKKNSINAFSDNNAKEYRCTSFECGKEFNSEQVKEYEKVEAVDKPKVPWSNRLTD